MLKLKIINDTDKGFEAQIIKDSSEEQSGIRILGLIKGTVTSDGLNEIGNLWLYDYLYFNTEEKIDELKELYDLINDVEGNNWIENKNA